MANVLLNEIAKREQAVAEYDGKVKELEAMKAKVAILENELATTDTTALEAEILELSTYANQLGFFVGHPDPVGEQGERGVPVETTEETTEEATAEETETTEASVTETTTNFIE